MANVIAPRSIVSEAMPDLSDLMQQLKDAQQDAQVSSSPKPQGPATQPMSPLRMGGPVLGATVAGELASPLTKTLMKAPHPTAKALGMFTQFAAMAGGAGLGTVFSEEIRNFLIKQEAIEGRTLSLDEIMMRAASEIKMEAGFGAGVFAATRGVGAVYRGILRKSAGINKEMRKQARIFFDRFGISQDIRTATPGTGLGGKIATGYENVVGRFPFMAGPLVKAAKRRIDEVSEAGDRLWLRIGPSIHLAERGFNLNKGVHKVFDVARENVRKNYVAARTYARESGAVVPAKSGDPDHTFILDEFNAIKKDVKTETPATRKPGRTKAGKMRPKVKKQPGGPLQQFMRKYRNLTDMTVDEYIGFMTEWDATISKMQRNNPSDANIEKMMRIKRAGERSFGNIKHSDPNTALEIQGMFDAADDYLIRVHNTFDNPVAKKFGKVTRKGGKAFGTVGFTSSGTLNPDELGRVIEGVKSPQGIDQLYKMLTMESPEVGKKIFTESFAGRLSDVWQESTKMIERGNDSIRMFDVDSFVRKLSLDKPHSVEFKTLERALSKTDVPLSDIKEFADLARTQLSPAVPDVSTFMARSTMLRGGTGGPGAAVKGMRCL